MGAVRRRPGPSTMMGRRRGGGSGDLMQSQDDPVVVGVDGSAAALAAVRSAAAEAAARKVGLRLVHAFAWSPHDAERPYAELRDGAAALLDRAVATARRIAP